MITPIMAGTETAKVTTGYDVYDDDAEVGKYDFEINDNYADRHRPYST